MVKKYYDAYKKKKLEKKVAEYKKRNEEWHREEPEMSKKLEELRFQRLKNSARNNAKKEISLEGKFCEKCGSKENLHRHHVDYYNMNVVVLCRSCHREIHFIKKLYKFGV